MHAIVAGSSCACAPRAQAYRAADELRTGSKLVP
jgi:hypothetical protein